MKRGNKSAAKGNHLEPIVVEPDDEFLSPVTGNNFLKEFNNLWFRDLDFSKDITNFHNSYTEVKKYSSIVEYKNGKLVKKDENGIHYVNDNGKGFLREMKTTPDGIVSNYKLIQK